MSTLAISDIDISDVPVPAYDAISALQAMRDGTVLYMPEGDGSDPRVDYGYTGDTSAVPGASCRFLLAHRLIEPGEQHGEGAVWTITERGRALLEHARPLAAFILRYESARLNRSLAGQEKAGRLFLIAQHEWAGRPDFSDLRLDALPRFASGVLSILYRLAPGKKIFIGSDLAAAAGSPRPVGADRSYIGGAEGESEEVDFVDTNVLIAAHLIGRDRRQERSGGPEVFVMTERGKAYGVARALEQP